MHFQRGLAFSSFVFLAGAAFYQSGAWSQQPAGSRLERFQAMSRKAEAEGLAKPFIGITASGQVTPGLFTLKSTGVSTEPVQRAAEAFLGGLDEAQRAKTQFPVDDPEWRKWMNQHFYIRQGVSFLEMTPAQRDLAFGLLRASLSAKGLKLSRDIMKLNHTLGELNQDDFEQYGEWRYHITVMGKPSSTEPWGWQIDGHHLIVNYFVLGDQVVMSPVFVGSEPVVAYEGKYKGTAILQDEQNQGFAFFQSLSAEQRGKAVIDGSKTRNNNIGEAFRDNVVLDWAGVRANDLSAKQKADLEKLIAMYVSNMDDGHAKVKMAEVRKHLDETRFAWVGGADANGVYYYRIHSPVILIEFDHQVLVGIRHLSKTPQLPDRQHIHVVVRTPNGNDYGKDLLRQHYLKHPHGA